MAEHQKWEYRIVVTRNDRVELINGLGNQALGKWQMLETYGNEGWELVGFAVDVQQLFNTFVFKRAKDR